MAGEENQSTLIGAITSFLKTPSSPTELVWRSAAAGVLIASSLFGIVLWQDPSLVVRNSPAEIGDLTERIKTHGHGDQLMQIMSSFINRHSPNRLALTARTSNITNELIWSNETTGDWPLSVDGHMGTRFAPILGHLVLSQCWVGAFPEHIDEYWVLCGLTDRDRHWGTLVAVFDKPIDNAMVDEVQILSVRLSEILLEGDLMAMNDRSRQ